MGGVSEREKEEEEEEDSQQVGGEDGYAVGVLQRCANGRETHVVTERVAQHWTHQVTCKTSKRGNTITKFDRRIAAMEDYTDAAKNHLIQNAPSRPLRAPDIFWE